MKTQMTAITIALILTIICFSFGYQQDTKADTVGRDKHLDLKYTYYYKLTGTAPYAMWTNKISGTVWDNTNSVLTATPTWGDADVPLADKLSTHGAWQVAVPVALPDGVYDLRIYDVSTAAASSDTLYAGKHVIVENARILKMSDI